MSRLRILIMNNSLASRAGSELYARRGDGAARPRATHRWFTARSAATIPVVDDLDSLATVPHIIHGHHHLETMTALLRFPDACRLVLPRLAPWGEAPPRFPRIRQY